MATIIECKRESKFITCGQVSLQDLDHFVSEGIVAVVNVRPSSEQTALTFAEADEVASRGLKYLHLPVAAATDYSIDKVRQLDEFLASLGEGNVVVHCFSGNRAAALLTLRAKLIDPSLSVDQALEFGHLLGLKPPHEAPITELLNEMK